LAERAEEAAVVRFLLASAEEDGLAALWKFPNPVAAFRAERALEKAAQKS
jgi:hypothetical protein